MARHPGPVAEVAGHHRGAAPERLHSGGDLFELGFGPRADHHIGADLCEGLRDRGADAAASRGHDGDPIGELEEVENHRRLPFFELGGRADARRSARIPTDGRDVSAFGRAAQSRVGLPPRSSPHVGPGLKGTSCGPMPGRSVASRG